MSTAVGSGQRRVAVSVCGCFSGCTLFVECKLGAASGFISLLFCCRCLRPAAGAAAGEEEEALPTYKDAFPPLPEKAASPEGTQETTNAWTSKIRPLKASVITQVERFTGFESVVVY